MNEEIVWLGSGPASENCAQVGDPDYARNAKAECRAYIQAIRKVCGQEPEGARLVVRECQYDCGEYYEVACVYAAENEWAAAYAARVDAQAPKTWEEAGMPAPRARRMGRT
jgi:hypothetical protein